MKKILLDTNLIIYREKNVVLDKRLSVLLRILYDSEVYKIVVHPLSIEELKRNRNKKDREIILSKISSYAIISDPPKATDEFQRLAGGERVPNDIIDNNLLYAIKQNCVSFFITNDARLRKRAKKVGLSESVLNIDEAIKRFRPEEEKELYRPVAVKRKHLYELNVADPFFETLSNDYYGFRSWFKKKAEQGQEAYCSFREKNKAIGSILYLKKETKDDTDMEIRHLFQNTKILKVSMMKVDDGGKCLGEVYIRLIFDEARKMNCKQIYVTVFPKYERLIDLLYEYGFSKVGIKNTKQSNGRRSEEWVLYRHLNQRGFPNISWKQKTFIVPIRPEFVEKLFPDAIENRQIHMDELFGGNVYSNAIRKAYICNSNCKQMCSGDTILFYASKKQKSLITIGVVDAIYTGFNSPEEVLEVARKRTVYTRDEIKNNFKAKSTKLILFKHYTVLQHSIPFTELKKNGILNGAPISIVQVDNKNVRQIIGKERGEYV